MSLAGRRKLSEAMSSPDMVADLAPKGVRGSLDGTNVLREVITVISWEARCSKDGSSKPTDLGGL